MYMLETDFDYGRRLVRDGQTINFCQDRPLPVEYRLLGQWLWQYDAAGLAESRQVPPTPTFSLDLLARTPNLLAHPAFRGWFARGEGVVEHAVAMFQPARLLFHADTPSNPVKGAARELAAAYFDEAMLEQLCGRLKATAEWLWRAGDALLAELAMFAAETVTQIPPGEHPFTRGMAEIGLTIAADQLRRMQGTRHPQSHR